MEEKRKVALPFLTDNHFIFPDGTVVVEPYASQVRFKQGGKYKVRLYPHKRRILKSSSNGKGYRRINVYGKTFYIHRLLAYAYLGLDLNSDMGVNHIDGDKSNNCLSNLEVVTCKENIRHAIETGLTPVGEMSARAILKEKDVLSIRKMREEGASLAHISRAFKVSESCVKGVVYRNNWKHL